MWHSVVRRWKNADPLVKLIGCSLMIGHILAELHGYMGDIWHDMNKIMVDWFWSPYFKMQLSIQWFVKTWFDDALYIFILYAFAKTVIDRSMKAYLIICMWMLYHLADMVCFMWDYKQSRYIYSALLWCCVFSTFFLILPKENKMKMV